MTINQSQRCIWHMDVCTGLDYTIWHSSTFQALQIQQCLNRFFHYLLLHMLFQARMLCFIHIQIQVLMTDHIVCNSWSLSYFMTTEDTRFYLFYFFTWLSLYGKELRDDPSKILLLCFTEKITAYGFGTPWGGVNNERFFKWTSNLMILKI